MLLVRSESKFDKYQSHLVNNKVTFGNHISIETGHDKVMLSTRRLSTSQVPKIKYIM